MKYVDEFRDPVTRRTACSREIEAWRLHAIGARGRPLHIMEVCGGHTHAIFRYGLDRHAAGEHRVRARPGLPRLRAADGRGSTIASRSPSARA